MIGVTLATPGWEALAETAAQLFARHTGLDVHIITKMPPRGRPAQHLKFTIWDEVRDDDVVYFDSDIACLRAWDPNHYAGTRGVGAVPDNPRSKRAGKDWATQGLPAKWQYFNSGLMILNRSHHQGLFEKALEHPPELHTTLVDQSALNWARHTLQYPIAMIHRRHNYIWAPKNGGLPPDLPITMVHMAGAHQKLSERFKMLQNPPKAPPVEPDRDMEDRLGGATLKAVGRKTTYAMRSGGWCEVSHTETTDKHRLSWWAIKDGDRTKLVMYRLTRSKVVFEWDGEQFVFQGSHPKARCNLTLVSEP